MRERTVGPAGEWAYDRLRVPFEVRDLIPVLDRCMDRARLPGRGSTQRRN